MKKVLICGSVGVNRGDDLMNRVLVNCFKRNNYNVTILSIRPEFIKSIYGQYSLSSSKSNILKWFNEIKNIDVVVIGGGTIIQNDFNKLFVSGILSYASLIIFIAKIVLRKKVLVIGIGVNKVSGINRVISKLFNFVDYICVRDAISVDNMNFNKISIKPEILFDIGLCRSLYDAWIPDKEDVFVKGEYICVSLVAERIKYVSENIANIILDYARKKDLKIVMIAMDDRETEELAIYNDFKNNFPDLIEIYRPDTPYQIIPIIKNARSCVAMRLHFSVICLTSGVKPFVVSREDKLQWLRDFVGAESYVSIDDADISNKILNYLNNDRGYLSSSVIDQLGEIDKNLNQKLNHIALNA